MFSNRLPFDQRINRLALAVEERRRLRKEVLDLTESNPTRATLRYPETEILEALSNPEALVYCPDPAGHPAAREAVAQYYGSRGHDVSAADVFLTCSTSEAYSVLFDLLADPGDMVLAPEPSYPLFDHLLSLRSVVKQPYRLFFDGQWNLPAETLERMITPRTRALLIVHPNNPTGSYASPAEWSLVDNLCSRHDVAVICDEVFFEYRLEVAHPYDPAANGACLSFVLGGLSKLCGLPQMKLSWIVLRGPQSLRTEAGRRLELILDTSLSVSTPIQVAVPHLMEAGLEVRERIRSRVVGNLAQLRRTLHGTAAEVLPVQGGWYAVARVPSVFSEEEWVIRLLKDEGVLLHPGYFYDFENEAYLVLSLLPEPALFDEGVQRLNRQLLKC